VLKQCLYPNLFDVVNTCCSNIPEKEIDSLNLF
jgi:hypothetical protein